MSDTQITLVGNLVADVDLRFTAAGAPVANFTVASTPRTFDRQANEWRDGEPMFLNCTVWRQQAENVANTLTKGTRVILVGRLGQRSYQTRDGDKRTVFEVQVDEIGPSLRSATAVITRVGARDITGGRHRQGGEDQWKATSSSQEAPF